MWEIGGKRFWCSESEVNAEMTQKRGEWPGRILYVEN